MTPPRLGLGREEARTMPRTMPDPGATFILKALNFVTGPVYPADNTAAPTGWSFRRRPVAVGEMHRHPDGAVETIGEELTNVEVTLLVQLLASVAARVR